MTRRRVSQPAGATLAALLLALSLRPAAAAAPAGEVGPPLILISIDGFRWDYLDLHPAPNLSRLGREGVRARGLVPIFPSKTFPNHYTIVTGLHPDRHGIVDNTMVDPVLGRFELSDREAVEDGRWWGGEPVWVTAERQGRRAATCFWPGSEAEIGGVRPSYWMRFDESLPGDRRVEVALEWLDLPAERRPVLVTIYWSDVDTAGHAYGPASAETRAAVERVDRWIGLLLQGLERRGLYDRVNLLVVSDHGMAPTPATQVLHLRDWVDLDGVEITGETPNLMLRPPPERVEPIRRALRRAHAALRVWRRERTPARWRFRDHPRIPPLLVTAEEGWNLLADRSGDRRARPLPLGMHGYDPRHHSMHGLLLGHGPGLASGRRVGRIENLHLYLLMCRLLGLEPAPNEGRPAAVRPLLASG